MNYRRIPGRWRAGDRVTLAVARSLVRAYFHVSDDLAADCILAAALRRAELPRRPWAELGLYERELRDRLESTRALFGDTFGLGRAE